VGDIGYVGCRSTMATVPLVHFAIIDVSNLAVLVIRR